MRSRRAFATLVALTGLAFLALALTAVARLAAIDAHRTRDALADAQCRQLLLAGLDALADGRSAPAVPHGFTLTAGSEGLRATTQRRAWVAEAAVAEGRLTATTLRRVPRERAESR